MTKRETVIAALKHQETPIVPYHMEFTQQALDQLVAYTRHPNIEEEIGSYLHYIQYWGWPAEIPGRPGYFQDEFGVIWNRNGAVTYLPAEEDMTWKFTGTFEPSCIL